MTIPNRYSGGALDLGEVKARAEAREQDAGQPSGIKTFFDVTESNLENDVLRRSTQVPVIVMVGSERAEANEPLKTDLKELAETGDRKFLVGYVNADTTPAVAQALGVQALPTVVAVAAGQGLTNFQGAQPRENLEEWLKAVVNSVGSQLEGLPGAAAEESEEVPSDPRLEQAVAALNSGAFDAALAVYDEILAEEPDNEEVAQAKKMAELLQRLDPSNREGDPIAEAEADRADVDKQMLAADAEVAAGAPEKGFERLVETMKTLAGDDKTRVKNRLLGLFELFAASDQRVLQARTKLASALY